MTGHHSGMLRGWKVRDGNLYRQSGSIGELTYSRHRQGCLMLRAAASKVCYNPRYTRKHHKGIASHNLVWRGKEGCPTGCRNVGDSFFKTIL